MKITLRVGTPFREALGERPELEGKGTTIKEFFDNIFLKFPAFKGKLFHANGELKSHVKIYINGVDIKEFGGLESLLRDEDVVQVLSIADGG